MVIPPENEAYRPGMATASTRKCTFPAQVEPMLAMLKGGFSGCIDVGPTVNDGSIKPRELVVKKTLVLVAMVLNLYSVGPAMAESRLGDRQGPATLHEASRQYQSIQNGFNLQPNQSELAMPDVSDQDGKVVDELYRKLMQEERARYPELCRSPASGPGAAAPTLPEDLP